MYQIFKLFVVAASAILLANATDYCSESVCGKDVRHIACGNSGNFASSCPSDAKIVNIDAALKATVVNGHNSKRNLVAGGSVANHDAACRMATMEWDDELAAVASFNVRQCAMSHDKCRNTDAFHYAGQNLAWIGYFGTPNNAALLTQAIDMWYGEVTDSKMEYINAYPSNYKGPTIGHFTVMVADRNVRVGCAAATYSVPGASYKAYLVACNYATTNMINFPIYASCSKPAEKCSTGANPLYSNLCSASEVYTVNKWF